MRADAAVARCLWGELVTTRTLTRVADESSG